MPEYILKPELFNDKTEETFRTFCEKANFSVCVGILANRVVAACVYEEQTCDDLIEVFKDMIESVLSFHPDFGYYEFNGGIAAVEMAEAMIMRVLMPEELKKYDGERPPFGDLYAYRNEILQACEEGNIIAVFIPDHNE